jgi:hypothetical protein
MIDVLNGLPMEVWEETSEMMIGRGILDWLKTLGEINYRIEEDVENGGGWVLKTEDGIVLASCPEGGSWAMDYRGMDELISPEGVFDLDTALSLYGIRVEVTGTGETEERRVNRADYARLLEAAEKFWEEKVAGPGLMWTGMLGHPGGKKMYAYGDWYWSFDCCFVDWSQSPDWSKEYDEKVHLQIVAAAALPDGNWVIFVGAPDMLLPLLITPGLVYDVESYRNDELDRIEDGIRLIANRDPGLAKGKGFTHFYIASSATPVKSFNGTLSPDAKVAILEAYLRGNTVDFEELNRLYHAMEYDAADRMVLDDGPYVVVKGHVHLVDP